MNLGARSIAEVLQERGVRLEYVLDEGGGIIEDGAAFGAPGVPLTMIDLMEKGYADLELTVESAGGHSSRPWGGSSLEHLSRAVTAPTRERSPLSARRVPRFSRWPRRRLPRR